MRAAIMFGIFLSSPSSIKYKKKILKCKNYNFSVAYFDDKRGHPKANWGFRQQDAEENIWTQQSGSWSTIHNEKLTIYNPCQISRVLSNKEQRLGRVSGTNGSKKKEFVSKTWRTEIIWKT